VLLLTTFLLPARCRNCRGEHPIRRRGKDVVLDGVAVAAEVDGVVEKRVENCIALDHGLVAQAARVVDGAVGWIGYRDNAELGGSHCVVLNLDVLDE